MDLQEALSNRPTIPVLSEYNSVDIELFVRAEIERRLQEKPRWLGDEESTRILKDHITCKLVEKANGM